MRSMLLLAALAMAVTAVPIQAASPSRADRAGIVLPHGVGKRGVVAGAPTAFDLFSNGVHEGTVRFERGDPTLENETSVNGDVALRVQTSALSAEVGALERIATSLGGRGGLASRLADVAKGVASGLPLGVTTARAACARASWRTCRATARTRPPVRRRAYAARSA